MQLAQIGGSFAQEASGIKLWEPLSDNELEALKNAWSECGVLVFRRQALSEAELADFSGHFGTLETIVRRDWQSANHPAVIHVSNLKDATGRSIGGLGSGELGWHSDQSYMAAPATGSLLYMVEMPREGGRTYWANLVQAYQTLPAELRAQAEGREGIFDYLARQSTYDDEAPMSPELRRKTPVVTHPLVNQHPVSGANALYLDPTTSVGVNGLPENEGRALLDALAAHATASQFVYAHQWQVGDVVMWDNGQVLHRRDPFDGSMNRLLKRTTFKLNPKRHIVPTGRPLHQPPLLET